MDTKESILYRMPKRPGNFGGETYREYCGLKSPRVTWGKRRESGRAVTAQDLYRAIVAHGGPK